MKPNKNNDKFEPIFNILKNKPKVYSMSRTIAIHSSDLNKQFDRLFYGRFQIVPFPRSPEKLLRADISIVKFPSTLKTFNLLVSGKFFKITYSTLTGWNVCLFTVLIRLEDFFIVSTLFENSFYCFLGSTRRFGIRDDIARRFNGEWKILHWQKHGLPCLKVVEESSRIFLFTPFILSQHCCNMRWLLI